MNIMNMAELASAWRISRWMIDREIVFMMASIGVGIDNV